MAITSMLPGVNGDALIGAFAGAVVFALHAKDISIIKRLVYMAVSFVVGYLAAPEVMRYSGLQSYTLASFAAPAMVITAALAGFDRIRTFGRSTLWKRG